MNKTTKKWAIISTAILLIGIVAIYSNPLRWSESCIKSYVLKITPLNSNIDDVIQIIKKQKWDVSYIDKDKGFLHQGLGPGKIVGSMSIRASLGDYQGIPFEANVTVFWGFNKEGKLTDIWVWKTWDAL